MCSILEGFPGGPEVKNLACNAGDTSSIPDGGTKIPRAARQVRLSPQLLNLLTTTGESVWHSLRSHMMPLRPDTNKYIYIYIYIYIYFMTPLVAQTVKHLPTMQETQVQSLGQEISWRRKWQPTPVLLPGKSHGWRSLVGYSPTRAYKESGY